MKQHIDILKTYWGHDSFRPGQADIIEAVLDGNDTMVLLPTGGGKSICFQLPTMQMEGICLVISPLIALMRDQVNNLKSRGIKAAAIYAGMRKREIDITLDNCIYGGIKFLYISPERLATTLFRERVGKMNVCLIAVDEAHCISQWGYDFRPSYLEIASIRSIIPKARIIAVTASATPAVQEDIIAKLDLTKPLIFRQSFSRENLSYAVLQTENKESKLLEIVKSVRDSKIIYVASRKSARALAKFLVSSGIKANYYHAGLSKDERTLVQEQWVSNKFKIMVATNAFGMGIDKPDVRMVVHYDLPGNLESYYQEAGRAGRDGLKAYAVLLYYNQDLDLLQTRFENSSPDIATLKNVYQCLANHLKLAIGSGHLASFSFDIAAFSTTYELDPLVAYYAIKKLENEGLIQLNEGFYNASKVFINHSKQDLYGFQIANERFDNLLKAMLRMYGGELFSDFCSIDESKIGKYLALPPAEIKTMLNALNELKVITYFPQADAPQLTFLTPRMDPKKLPIDASVFEKKRNQDQRRIDAIVQYVNNVNQCRTQQIVNYFGEDNDAHCGICDWCLKRKPTRDRTNEISDIVLKQLDQQSLSPDELCQLFDDVDEKQLAIIIQLLLDNNQIKYLKNGQLVRY